MVNKCKYTGIIKFFKNYKVERNKNKYINKIINKMKTVKKEFPTYFDLKYSKESSIFEAEQIKNLTPEQIREAEEFYNLLVEKLQKGESIDEGILGSIVGGAAGFLVGPAIGKAICSVLGIKEDGPLGKLLTSRLVTTALGIALGK